MVRTVRKAPLQCSGDATSCGSAARNDAGAAPPGGVGVQPVGRRCRPSRTARGAWARAL